MLKLHNFFRSGTSHRLRIALNLKGLPYDYVGYDLRVDEHLNGPYRQLNPQALVPALELDDARVLIQSPAIIEWLEEVQPEPPLLPSDPNDRAHVRALAAIIGCDIHPLNNRRVLETLRKQYGADGDAINAWCGTWISAGFDALEVLLAADTARGDFCFGNAPGLVDCYLIPQVESARRFKVDLARWPLIQRIDAACSELDAFRRAAPIAQPDAGS